MLPTVDITKQDFQTGSVAPSPVGVLAIVAPANAGPKNEPTSCTSDALALSEFGASPLVEDASYVLAQAGKPVVLIRSDASGGADYGDFDVTGMLGGTTTPTGSGTPADAYAVTVTFLDGGTVGDPGKRWTVDLGGGPSAPMPIPSTVPAVLVVPAFPNGASPGVSFSLAGGTFAAGGVFKTTTKPASLTDSDVSTSLEALRTTTLDWEAVLVDEVAGSGTTAMLDTWLAGLEKVGKFKMAFLNTRMKAANETESDYATALEADVAGMSPTIRASLGADGGFVTSRITGLTQARPTSLIVAARSMANDVGVEPAANELGPLGGVRIVDGKGNPLFHNEESFPDLDQLLVTTLRSVHGQTGVYVTNGRIFSTTGSDYVLIPHARAMNRALELTFAILMTQLSRGVGKKPRDPKTGKVTILEGDALAIEGLVNSTVRPQLAGQVQAFQFSLSRDDDLAANSGPILTGRAALVALAYVKGFKVNAAFARSLQVAA